MMSSTDERRVLSEDGVEGEGLGRSGSSARCGRRRGARSTDGLVEQRHLMQVLVTAEERTATGVDWTHSQHHFHLDHTHAHTYTCQSIINALLRFLTVTIQHKPNNYDKGTQTLALPSDSS